MQMMGLKAIHPQPQTTVVHPQHRKYPYLLRYSEINRPNQVRAVDIAYIPLSGRFMYLVAIMDWYSRYVLTWRLSNTLDGAFCLAALREELNHAQPETFNADQGVQFTAHEFTGTLE